VAIGVAATRVAVATAYRTLFTAVSGMQSVGERNAPDLVALWRGRWLRDGREST
jgi:hypothetical protein